MPKRSYCIIAKAGAARQNKRKNAVCAAFEAVRKAFVLNTPKKINFTDGNQRTPRPSESCAPQSGLCKTANITIWDFRANSREDLPCFFTLTDNSQKNGPAAACRKNNAAPASAYTDSNTIYREILICFNTFLSYLLCFRHL